MEVSMNFPSVGGVGVAARIIAEHRGCFSRHGTQFSGGGDRLGCPAGSVRRLLPVVLQQGAAESMPGGLPRLQRQHQPPLWKLRSLRLLPHGDNLLQRFVRQSRQRRRPLRRLRHLV
jgi:hypothetical protein